MDKELLHKYIIGDATTEEKEDVARWIDADEANMKEFLALHKVYNISIWQSKAIENESDNKQKQKQHHIQILWEATKIAALFILAFGASIYIYNYFTNQHKAILQTMYVPAGQRAELTLADGSHVWLNAKTTFTFPTNFDTKNRVVSLNGEGYFKVAHNAKKPFIVKTQLYDVKALGTEFNVYAYKEDKKFESALLKGSIQIESKISGKQILLQPDNMLHSENGHITISPITQYNYFRWKDGLICFDDLTINEMLSKLKIYFDIDFIVKNNQILNQRYSGKFRTNDGIEHILKTLQLDTKFDYEISEDEHIITIK
jgi:transmembrane sensor